MVLRKFVSKLSKETLLGIHESYTKFEEQGAIGDEPCRVETMRFLVEHNITDDHVVIWMRALVFEVYRRLALEAL